MGQKPTFGLKTLNNFAPQKDAAVKNTKIIIKHNVYIAVKVIESQMKYLPKCINSKYFPLILHCCVPLMLLFGIVY